MEGKYLLLSLEDSRAKKISEILGNTTCKKIIDALAEKEKSETDLSEKLKIPLNTIEYNLKKLIEAGLVEKTSNFFWSKKGKKIPMYKLSHKSIVISPTSKILSSFKSLLPVALISGFISLIIRQFYSVKTNAVALEEKAIFSTADLAQRAPETFVTASVPEVWIWFLAGALFGLLLMALLNLRKMKGGK